MKTTNTANTNRTEQLFGIASRALSKGAWVTARFALAAMVSEHLDSAAGILPEVDTSELGAEYAAVITGQIRAWNTAAAAYAA